MNQSPLAISILILALIASFAIAQFGPPGRPPGRPPMRKHTVTQSKDLSLVPANVDPPTSSKVEVEVRGRDRVVAANGIPDHQTGRFPNRGNPHRIAAQDYEYRVPAEPSESRRVTPLPMQNFGVAVNGVPFDPGAAEWYGGNPRSGWQYEALSGAVPLGIDANYAHVQPNGAYHYHGLPTDLLKNLKVDGSGHSPIVGWAADGFPIYALYGFKDAKDANSEVAELKASWRVKSGRRPGGAGNPGGSYDGTFIADYEYVEGLGDLDECNGRHCVTPDFPDGTYAYFLTNDWPVIPRAFRGTPSRDFERGRGPGR